MSGPRPLRFSLLILHRATNRLLDSIVHNAGMPKYTLKQLVIAAVVLILLASASATAHASADGTSHAYTTSSSGVKAGFGFGLLAFGGIAVLTFLSRAVVEKIRR